MIKYQVRPISSAGCSKRAVRTVRWSSRTEVKDVAVILNDLRRDLSQTELKGCWSSELKARYHSILIYCWSQFVVKRYHCCEEKSGALLSHQFSCCWVRSLQTIQNSSIGLTMISDHNDRYNEIISYQKTCFCCCDEATENALSLLRSRNINIVVHIQFSQWRAVYQLAFLWLLNISQENYMCRKYLWLRSVFHRLTLDTAINDDQPGYNDQP